MPDASEPPMWKSHGSPAFWRTRMTSIGRPRAAHTLLKLIPAAITATSTWSGARAGTSTSSTWNAVRQARSLRVQVAGGPAAGHREGLRVDLPADVHRVRAAAVEAAAARRIGGAGDVAVQDDALAGPLHPGVGDRHRRQQRLAVRV